MKGPGPIVIDAETSGFRNTNVVRRGNFQPIVDFILSSLTSTADLIGADVLSSSIFLTISQSRDVGVSIFAISECLGLPYETVRRRVEALRDAGQIDKQDTGRWVECRGVRAADDDHDHRIVQLFLAAMSASGLDDIRDEAFNAAVDSASFCRKTTSDILCKIPLRAIEFGLRFFPSITDAVIFLTVMNINVASSRDLAAQTATDLRVYTLTPNPVWIPAKSADVAAQLGMHRETVRRRLIELTKLGQCERFQNGYLASRRFIADPEVAAAWSKTLEAFEQSKRDFAKLLKGEGAQRRL